MGFRGSALDRGMIPANPGKWLPMEAGLLVFSLWMGTHLKIPRVLDNKTTMTVARRLRSVGSTKSLNFQSLNASGKRSGEAWGRPADRLMGNECRRSSGGQFDPGGSGHRKHRQHSLQREVTVALESQRLQ